MYHVFPDTNPFCILINHHLTWLYVSIEISLNVFGKLSTAWLGPMYVHKPEELHISRNAKLMSILYGCNVWFGAPIQVLK